MAILKISSMSRVAYDPENEAIRSYYDPTGVGEMKGVAAETVAQQFLRENLSYLKFKLENVIYVGVKNASGFQSVRYLQHFGNVPVYGATVVVNVGRNRGNVFSLYNNFDYNIPDEFNTTPTKPEEDASKIADSALSQVFENVNIAKCTLYIYRHRVFPGDIGSQPTLMKRPDAERMKILRTIPVTVPKEGDLFLVWSLVAEVRAPFSTSLELLIDAKTGDIIVVRDRSDYVSGTGKVFIPDPVTSSGNVNLVTSTPGSIAPASTFDPERRDVTLLDLDPSDTSGKYHLTGPWCRIQDFDSPTLDPPSESTPSFNYSTDKRHFLAVMAYYWIDTAQRFIQNDLGVTDAADYQIEVDPQGCGGIDNSYFVPGSTHGDGRITFGEGNAPDASDAAVILHEYGHAIHDDQEFDDFAGDLGQGFSDLFARIYLDRFNPNQVLREWVFPFDNNPNASYCWNPYRRVDLTENYSKYDEPPDKKYSVLDWNGDIWATTVWQIYLALGGASVYQGVRNWAADLVLKLHLEANVGYGSITTGYTTPYAHHQRMAEALEMADHALNNWRYLPDGLFHKVIRDRCIRRGLLDPLNVDVYIDDGRDGGYDYLENFWHCQDIVVRRKSTDTPAMGHEEPIVNEKNYLWVKVKKKGTGSPELVNVKAFSASPAAGLMWPTHFTPASPASKPATTLETATEEWVGPFEFIPTEVSHACVLAIVEAGSDPANTESLPPGVQLPLWRFVPFDNNIGQRNLSPVQGKGGKQAHKFRVTNSMEYPVSVSLDVKHDLPPTWVLQFDVPDIKNIPIPPYGEKWITLQVSVPPGQGIKCVSERARVTITSFTDGIPEGGMTFEFAHPSLFPEFEPDDIIMPVEGDVSVIFEYGKRTSFGNEFWLYKPTEKLLFKAMEENLSKKFRVGRFGAGTRLVFALKTPDKHTYYTNSSLNEDKCDHTIRTKLTEYSYRYVWEETWRLRDRDFGDLKVKVTITPLR